jgi:integrase
MNTSELLGHFLTHCKNKGLSRETLRYYKDFLIKFADKYPQLPLAPEPIEEWIATFTSSPERRYGAFRAVRTFYNFCERRFWPEQGPANPIGNVARPRVLPKAKAVLTLDELKQLLEYPGHSQIARTLLHLLADTGCRIGECPGIRRTDIHGNTLKISGKTGERVVPISPKVRDMLLSIKPHKTGRLFPHLAHWWSQVVSKAFKDAGIKGTAHLLRFTFASHWRGSDQVLKQIGGWATWTMVEHYSHLRLEKAIDQHREYSPLARLYGTPVPTLDKGRTAEANTDTMLNLVAELAQELGAAKERIKYLEASQYARQN